MRHVPQMQPYMATSCCPAWSVMAKKEFPGRRAVYLYDHDSHGAYGSTAEKNVNPGL